MEEKAVLLTQEGYDNLEKELEYLRTEKRAEVAERIKIALGYGDLSENSEYDEAKTAQAENEAKIADLENKIRYAQIIDDEKQVTLVVASTLDKEVKTKASNIEAAKEVGALIAKKALEKKIDTVVFDRNGYLYHGKVKALAEAAREAGLKF